MNINPINAPEPQPDEQIYTVIGLWKNGDTHVEYVAATDPREAMQIVAGCRDNPAELEIIGAAPGKFPAFASPGNDGKAKRASDLLGSPVSKIDSLRVPEAQLFRNILEDSFPWLCSPEDTPGRDQWPGAIQMLIMLHDELKERASI